MNEAIRGLHQDANEGWRWWREAMLQLDLTEKQRDTMQQMWLEAEAEIERLRLFEEGLRCVKLGLTTPESFMAEALEAVRD